MAVERLRACSCTIAPTLSVPTETIAHRNYRTTRLLLARDPSPVSLTDIVLGPRGACPTPGAASPHLSPSHCASWLSGCASFLRIFMPHGGALPCFLDVAAVAVSAGGVAAVLAIAVIAAVYRPPLHFRRSQALLSIAGTGRVVNVGPLGIGD